MPRRALKLLVKQNILKGQTAHSTGDSRIWGQHFLFSVFLCTPYFSWGSCHYLCVDSHSLLPCALQKISFKCTWAHNALSRVSGCPGVRVSSSRACQVVPVTSCRKLDFVYLLFIFCLCVFFFFSVKALLVHQRYDLPECDKYRHLKSLDCCLSNVANHQAY